MEQVQRIFLYAALFIVAFFLWQSWNKYNIELQNARIKQVSTSSSSLSRQGLPETITTNDNTFANVPAAPHLKTDSEQTLAEVPSERLIKVKTDVFDLSIDSQGGNIVSLNLIKYPVSLQQKNTPITLLSNKPENYYVSQSALMSKDGPDYKGKLALYQTSEKSYTMKGDTLKVNLTWKNDKGIEVIKTYTFHKNSYLIDVSYQIINNSKSNWTGSFYAQLTRKPIKESGSHLFQIHPYFGAAYSSPDKRYNEISFKDMKSEPLNQSIKNGWAAMVERYFVSAWVPDPNTDFQYYSQVKANDLYSIGMYSQPITVAPGKIQTVNAKLYSGPEITSVLKNIAPGLEQTVSYGWLWFISVIVFWVMEKIYLVVGNWGWSIILVTVLIKLMFFPLSAKSYKSMARMRGLQPKIKALRERFSDDKQKQSQAMMELYKKEKVNPVGGCLPIIVQIPVFFALYMVLIESVQLRQAPWILWIHDLSVPDPYFILPVLMGVTMFVQQKLNPPPPDPTQAKVMMFLPVVFTVLFAYFPAGLVLYWVVNNALSILQQWHITRQVEQNESRKKIRKKKK